MPPRLFSYREVRRKLLAAGFIDSSRRGSHVKFSKTEQTHRRTVIVPDHRDVARGTLRSILRQAGLTPDAFDDL
ncbi:MAG: type II toxin-antitoxin system HicA family toxin [Proteobacteria bacterium]|nr:type II toxin-antitoxin system HicA family toxin [Pseudomonadota bacterium]